MRRLSALLLGRDERRVLRLLGTLGVIELTRIAAGPEVGSLPPRLDRERVRWEKVVARIQELRRTLEIKPGEPGFRIGAERLATAVERPLSDTEEALAAMEKTAGDLLEKRAQLLRQRAGLATEAERLQPYCGLGIPLDRPDESAFLHFVIGSLPPENFERLWNEIGSNAALMPLPVEKARRQLMAMTTRQGWPALENALRRAGFQPDALPVMTGATVDTAVDANGREQARLETEWRGLEAGCRALAGEFAGPLAEMESAAKTELSLLEAGQNGSRTETTVLLSGWIPGTEVPGLERRLLDLTGGRCLLEISEPQNPFSGEIPVLLRHPRWLRPFERLMSAYGLPHYGELAPTLFVAVSYLLMFGMMFGDLGQGAVLALAGWAAWRAGRQAQTRDVGRLLLFGGGSSMLFGALYGSCFGIPAFKPLALWQDPLQGNPLALMRSAIVVGVALISLGLVLNILNRFRRGDFLGAFLGKYGVAGAVFYWGSLALAAKSVAVQSHGGLPPVILLVLALPVLAWMLKEPLELFLGRRAENTLASGRGLADTLAESLVGAFEGVLGYFANTLSFVRLAAYAMSHATLLAAAFLMADAVKSVSPAGGWLSVGVIVLGNAITIALEGVVASVQALRLEYYEFFGKFFSGGGRPFKPFCLPTPTAAATPL